MANAKPLTRDDLKSVFKDLGVATKEDLKQFATREDLKAMEGRQDKKYATKEDLKAMEGRQDKKMQESLLHLERRLKLRMGKHRTEIFAMFGRLATSTPSRREFEELKGHTGRFIAHS
ncbi:hypothetical protein HY339_00795 [Candidatus Gottesmanbacteria bacterium]|nr:hypothetical protein [Candidatus Gottesmanbacteria bacterium]